ncbi:MAG: N-glycosylase/DNA lyase [Candidatus Lokiarchaeota archaeon]|nr:N-glycosylase/DNA lyase [Candidatus Lokiarchaeota archaeon]
MEESLGNLINSLEISKKSELNGLIKERISEFKEVGNSTSSDIFKELCFCILTANCAAEKCMYVQEELADEVLKLNEEELASRLKELGYRFPNVRAKYIYEAREYAKNLKEMIQSFASSEDLRLFLAKNIKGLGFKEASHFLRNIGYEDLAIIDFHIIDVLSSHKLLEKPKTITKKKYLEIEEILRKIGKTVNLNLAELDLYLWHMETGKILK